MITHSVYVTDPKTGEETYYPSVKDASNAIGACARHVRNACLRGYKCRGFYCRYGEVVPVEDKRGKSRPNICFDCKNACGKCPWTELDPVTLRPRFAPVPGWTAEKVLLNCGELVETYHITACPLFTKDDPRKENHRELTYTENRDFLENVGYLLKRWEHG